LASVPGISYAHGAAFTDSIINGIGAGFLAFAVLKLRPSGSARSIQSCRAASLALVVYFALAG